MSALLMLCLEDIECAITGNNRLAVRTGYYVMYMAEKLIDWDEVWKNRMLRYNESHGHMDCADFWENKKIAKHYLSTAENNKKGRIEETIRDIVISPMSRVLDIGSGPGTLTIPLAEKVAHVTAIEPAEGMLSVLQEKIAEHGLINIACIQKKWEHIDITKDLEGPYDVVIASLSLGMQDIRKSILKMIDACSKYIYLYWFAGEPAWEIRYKKLWPALHGTDYHASPKCDILFNVLYNIDIYPHITVLPYKHCNRFYSLDEAVEYFIPRYRITMYRQKQILRNYLKQILDEDNDSLLLWTSATYVKIWWEKQGSDD